jgi:hypothetical protein
MADDPAPPPIRSRRPVKAGDELPTTIVELNRKVDAIVKNGSVAIDEVRELIKKKDRSRRMTMLVAALALFASVGVVGVQHQRCRDHNAENAKTMQLWEFVIQLSDSSPTQQTPEQRAQQVKAFRSYLAGAYPQRDCWPLNDLA